MPEMNKPAVNIPSQGYNPISAASTGLNKFAGEYKAKGRDAFQAKVAVHMQGQQHQHEQLMQTGQHEHERGLALIHGAVGIETAKIGARAQVAVAKAHGASQVDIAKIQTDGALKQQIAGQRHELRLGVQQHHQDLEKQAQAHHETVQAGIYDSLNRRAEVQQQNDHALATQRLADTHAGNASDRAKSFLETLRQHAEPGSEANISHEGINVNFTTRSEKPAEPAPAPATPAAAPEPETPAKTRKFAHRDPVTKKITGYHDTPQTDLPASPKPIKKAVAPKPVKKAAAKKPEPQPTVARDPKTGRMRSLKKK